MEQEPFKVEYTNTVFFIRLNKKDKAWLTYEVEDGVMTLKQTYTPEQYRGKGLAKMLVDKAVEVAKQKNLKIKPVCSYSVYYFLKNPQEREILAEPYRSMSEEELKAYFEKRLEEEKSH
jgi:Predicted acetyltransferase